MQKRFFFFLTNSRINRFSDGFFPSTSRLWNSLPSSVFPASFNLPPFKRQVYHHLRDQMAWIFFYYHFGCFINLFYSFHCLSFPSLRDADSRKGTLCPFCVPIHMKKKKKENNSSLGRMCSTCPLGVNPFSAKPIFGRIFFFFFFFFFFYSYFAVSWHSG